MHFFGFCGVHFMNGTLKSGHAAVNRKPSCYASFTNFLKQTAKFNNRTVREVCSDQLTPTKIGFFSSAAIYS